MRRTRRDASPLARAQGRETNTDASFRDLTRPKVLTKAGALIDPIKMSSGKQAAPGLDGKFARKAPAPAPARPRKSAL